MNAPAVITAGGLTLTRSASGGHRIELRDGGALVACFASIEPGEAGTEKHATWPASPPVQEWHDETRAGVSVLMAVGRAGRSHWSLSCEVKSGGRAAFDVAARIGEPPERLGSSYLLSEGTPVQVTAGRLQLPGGWQLAVDPLTTQLRFDAETRLVTIDPVSEHTAAWPQTIRWGYAFYR